MHPLRDGSFLTNPSHVGFTDCIRQVSRRSPALPPVPVTAADGAEEFYTTTNNTARLESPEEARELDKKTMQVYLSQG